MVKIWEPGPPGRCRGSGHARPAGVHAEFEFQLTTEHTNDTLDCHGVLAGAQAQLALSIFA